MYHQNKHYVQTAIYIKLKMKNYFWLNAQNMRKSENLCLSQLSELSIHFNDLSNYYKFIWIMSNENVTLIKELGIFLTIASEKQALSYQ